MESQLGFAASLLRAEIEQLIITGTSLKIKRSRRGALGLYGEKAAKALDGARARGPCRGWSPRGYEVHLSGIHPSWGSRGCWTAIDRQIHGVLTWWDCGGRSGGANWVRSSRTLLECGSVVICAVAAMGGQGRTTGWHWLVVSALGAPGILTSLRRASLVKGTNRAHRVGGGAMLLGMSVSPAVCTRGGSVG